MESSGASVPNSDVVRVYDRWATWYDRFVAPMESGTRRRALESLAIDAGDRALELGCGPGRALVPLARLVGRTGRVVGLDAAPGMIARARRRVAQSGTSGRTDLVLGDARALPFADGAVDVIFVEDTLELFGPSEMRAVLDECARVLTADGRLGVVTMEREAAERDPFVRAYEWVYDRVPGYDRVGCRPVYARRSLVASGFTVDRRERRRRGHVWPVEILIAHPAEQ